MAALAVAAGMLACDDDSKINGEGGEDTPDDVVPNFPELVEDYAVEPGSVQEVVFTPNLAWEVSVPNEIRQWFWIKDGSFSVTSLKGEASEEPVTVYVGVTENTEFDKNYSCDVTLTMGGESKVIAKYMLPAKEKTLDVYMAQKNEDGSFKMADDGVTYVYEATAATEAELLWSAESGKFILPLRVESNCEWTVKTPEWADVNVPENTVGVVEIVLTGFSLDAADGELEFLNGETSLKKMDVSVPQGKDMAVYAAVKSDDGYETGEDGKAFKWNEKPAERLELTWTGNDFRVPVLIDAKCDWIVEFPEWLQAVTYPDMEALPAETAGQLVVILKGVPSRYPLDDAEGKVIFKVGETVVHELTAAIPGCKGIMTYYLNMGLTALEYNHLGAVNTSTGYVEELATGTVFGPKDVRIFAVETTGGKVGSVLSGSDAWFRMEISSFVEGKDSDVLQERTISFSVEENSGDYRSAVLFILPQNVTVEVADLFNEDASVKTEYAEWAVAVSQSSMNYADYVQMSNVEDADFEFAKITDEARRTELITAFGETEHLYTLTYGDVYASEDARMSLSIPYTSYLVYDADMLTDRTTDGAFWLDFAVADENNRTAGAAEMYLGKDLPPVPSVGYIVFKGSDGKVLAVVECVSPAGDYISMPSSDSDKDLPYSFSVHSDAGKAELAAAFGATDNVYRITYTDLTANELAVMELSAPYSSYKVFDADKVTERTDDGDFWLTLVAKDADRTFAGVVMYDEMELPLEPSVGYVVFYGADGSVYAVVECVSPVGEAEDLDPDTKIDVSAERFADPATASAAGATVYEITAGPTFDRYKEYTCPILKLVYTKSATSLLLNVPTSTFQFTLYDNTGDESWIKVDGKDIYNDAGYIWDWNDKKGGYVGSSPDGKSYDGTAEISMTASVSTSANMLLHPRNSNNSTVVCVIVCVLDLD